MLRHPGPLLLYGNVMISGTWCVVGVHSRRSVTSLPAFWYSSRAHRAPSSLPPRPRVHNRFPNMPLRAQPPDFPPAAYSNSLRGQAPIQRGMPTLRHFGLQGGKVVKPFQYFLPSTIRASRPIHRPGPHGCLVGMSQLTAPPHPPVTGGGALLWG